MEKNMKKLLICSGLFLSALFLSGCQQNNDIQEFSCIFNNQEVNFVGYYNGSSTGRTTSADDDYYEFLNLNKVQYKLPKSSCLYRTINLPQELVNGIETANSKDENVMDKNPLFALDEDKVSQYIPGWKDLKYNRVTNILPEDSVGNVICVIENYRMVFKAENFIESSDVKYYYMSGGKTMSFSSKSCHNTEYIASL